MNKGLPRRQTGFVPVLIILVIALLGIGGYFIAQGYYGENDKNVSNTTETETYINNEAGFRFNYPKTDFKTIDESNNKYSIGEGLFTVKYTKEDDVKTFIDENYPGVNFDYVTYLGENDTRQRAILGDRADQVHIILEHNGYVIEIFAPLKDKINNTGIYSTFKFTNEQ